jgi:hypothetical protein
MLILVGVQLMIYWILMRVLEELSQREIVAKSERVAQVSQVAVRPQEDLNAA